MRRGIRVPIEHEIVEYSTSLEQFVWEAVTHAYGEERRLGKFYNFRTDGPTVLVMDFEPEPLFGDQLLRDIDSNAIQIQTRFVPESEGKEIIHGTLKFFLVGNLRLPEPATTVCDEPKCEKIFPAIDAYSSIRFPGRQICPECYEHGEQLKRYKLKGENQSVEVEGEQA